MISNQKTILNLKDVSEYTGFKISYIYKLTSSGVLPHSKPNGKTIFVEKIKLEQWLLSNATASLSDKKIIASNYVATNSATSGRKKKNK